MKLLRNPLVVGILALVAVVMVLYQTFGDRLFRVSRLVASTPAPAAGQSLTPSPAVPAAPAPASQRALTYTNAEDALLSARGVDASVVEPRFTAWVSAPLRDPFLLLAPVVREPGLLTDQTNSPVSTWILQAIWNQTGSRLAVINDHVFRVGEVIEEGYKLIRIEKDEVWFQGPYQNERLGFHEPKKVESKTPAPQPLGKRTGKKM
jgi:hypothetical protein